MMLSPGCIYLFADAGLNTEVPHYFVCLTCSDPDLEYGFVVCTTQKSKRTAAIKFNNYPEDTLVEISPSKKNKLKSISYVDCNSYFQKAPSQVEQMVKYGGLEYVGELEEFYLAALLNGLSISPVHEGRMRRFFNNELEEMLRR